MEGRGVRLNEEIQHISLHNLRPVILHGYVAPFIGLFAAWTYVWTTSWGVEEYWEMGMIGYGIVGLLQVLVCLFCGWFVPIRCLLTCSKSNDPFTATVVQVVPTPNNGSTELVKLFKQKDSATGRDKLCFVFQKMKYTFDAEEKKSFVSVNFPVDHSINYYMECKGYLEDADVQAAERHYGKNIMKLDIPQFMDLFKERATAPFFVFQVFCVGLWCLDEYWYYSVFTLIMLVTFEATLVQQQLRNMTEIRKMGTKPYLIQCYRNRRWRPLMSDELVPGDLVSIGRSQDEKLVPCDMLLLRGSCIVDESMLTGESVPVMKESVECLESDAVLDMDTHGKLHVLSGGTKVVQHSPPSKTSAGLKATDNGCVGYVLRNSYSTSQGKLLRTILFGVKQVTANNVETFFFIVFLLIFAITAAVYVWIKGSEDPDRNRYKLFLECTLILTSVVPPELPIELSLAVNTSLLALSKLYVFCTEPFRIPFAGKVDICCFDKTGTLTSDNLVVEGIAGLIGSNKMSSVSEVPITTIHVLASCNSLALLDDGEMVGDPLEKATLHSIEWNITKGDGVVPRRGKSHGLKIFHRFHFSSSLKRMSVIAGHNPLGSVDTDYIATVKGAPEILRTMLREVPENYDQVYLEMARRGARVLALGYKKLGLLTHQQVREMTREQVECELIFAGFVIISCPLKMDSKNVIHEIQEASHHVVMITGDNPLTACHVAQEIKITQKFQTHTLILSQTKNRYDETEWSWRSIDDELSLPPIPEGGYKQFIKDYDLCLTGEALFYLSSSHLKFLHNIFPHIKVYARVAPKQKEFVITSLKQLGYVTLMCGDGTNDVGALKHAHVGVALIANAPERVPEPKKIKKLQEQEAEAIQDSKNPRSARSRRPRPTIGRSDSAPARPADHIPQSQKKLQQMLKELEEEEKSQVVRLGDASIASPFTSKLSTTMCVCHIIKQGRCTLVTTLQMFKILALNALVLAYSQSVLYLEGIKFSDTQATMQGLLLAGCFLFISRSKPLQTLSKERPLANIFNAHTMLTVILQFFIHFGSLVYLKTEAQARSPPKEGKFPNLEKEFEPNIINTTVYVISMAMQVTTFAVNYKGHPFMASLTENKPLLYSLMFSGCSIAALASGLVPDMSAHFELIELPPDFRNIVMITLGLDLIGSFVIDRILLFICGKTRLRGS